MCVCVTGIVWFRWRGWDYTLKRASMMIKPKGLQPNTWTPIPAAHLAYQPLFTHYLDSTKPGAIFTISPTIRKATKNFNDFFYYPNCSIGPAVTLQNILDYFRKIWTFYTTQIDYPNMRDRYSGMREHIHICPPAQLFSVVTNFHTLYVPCCVGTN